ncbi:endonuclease/exonuclease/phosphatase family protein [Streptomyces tuirus]|uniref:Endonuclease/exonuclease/phosphatase family protein n=1 Tax=Streptomyces tuirus TaxID=68278 RepID=A0A941FCU6_9ACTN|nr:endonuclease/exonuclease/phosphatase family protein [Streptomyces tuirus]
MTDVTPGMRLMTMNVLAPQYADGPGRRAVLARELRRREPDVLALQEVTRGDVAALVDAGWHVVPHPRWSSDGVGAVLAARRPFGRTVTDPLEVTRRTANTSWCGVVAAELPLPEPLGTVLVVHHKPSWPYGYERERELQALVAARLVERVVAEHPVRHTVMLGDFDAPPQAASVRFLKGLQSLDGMSVCFEDTWSAVHPGEPGPTFSSGNPLVRQGDMPEVSDRRIDYILLRCGPHGPTLRVSSCRRVLVEPVAGVHASDHYGLVTDLTLPDHSPGRWA